MKHSIRRGLFRALAAIGSLLSLAPGALGQVKLPAILSRGMVLQQDSVVPFWGRAGPGERIEIRASWGQTKYLGRADENGAWRIPVRVPPATSAQGPQTIFILGSTRVPIEDVLIGEVWLCSGQSNMEMWVGQVPGKLGGVTNWEREVESANIPDIRLFDVPNEVSATPRTDCAGSWGRCTPERARSFSATAFFFGRELHEELQVPIGLITADWGGTPIQAWTSLEGLRSQQGFEAWIAKLSQMGEEGEPAAAPGPHSPAMLYNGMIAPIEGYGVRGVTWYQGESNRAEAFRYRGMFRSMIGDWRRAWRAGELPFYFVQIAPFAYGNDRGETAELREAQAAALLMPNTGMAVTMDIGDPSDIHPRNKQEVGRRLALCALAGTYKREIESSGPVYKSMGTNEGAIWIRFDHGAGLAPADAPLTCFTIAGEDRTFVPAEAKVDGDAVVVRSDAVPSPVAVRFAWGAADQPNLKNGAGLPAAPFRTDDWPGVTQPADALK